MFVTKLERSLPLRSNEGELLVAETSRSEMRKTFWLTFDVEFLSRVTLVQQLTRLRRHFFLDFIFQ